MAESIAPKDGDENFVLSPDGATLYVAGNDGVLRVYDSATGTLLHSWNVGVDLDAIAISRDGRYAVITEAVPVSTHQTNDWTSNVTVAAVYQVDLRSGYVEIFNYTGLGELYTFADVAFTDDNVVLLSQNILPGWSGWAPLQTLDLNSGVFAPHDSYYSGLGSAASLNQALSSGNVLVGQLGLSSAEYFLVDSDGNRVLSNGGSYSNGVNGYAGGIEAFVGSGASGRVAVVTGGGLHLYNGAFGYIGDLAEIYPELGNSSGVVFSRDGKVLYALDPYNDEIVAVALDDFTVIQRIALGDVDFHTLQWGDELVLSPDGLTFYVATTNGVLSVDRPTDNIRTDGNDSLIGTTGADTISGGDGNDLISTLGGDDTLIGGAGNDQLAGGTGDDYYIVDAQSDVIVELAGEGEDVVFASSNFYLHSNVEALVLEAAAGNAFGVGNELDNLIVGNAGDNLLLGGAGRDEVYGAEANDSIFGEGGDDKLFGEAGVDYLAGGAGHDSIDGGAGADAIYGEAGNDILFGGSTFDTDILVGGGGNDTLYGDSGRGDYDLLYGNEGNDSFWVDTPADLVFEQAGEGVDTVYADIEGAGYYLYANIENLVLIDNTPFGVGNDLDNALTGSAGSNWLLGGAGNDVLSGGKGNDVLFGESGADTFPFQAGDGADVIGDFVHGQDKIQLTGSYANFDALSAHFIQNGADGAIDLGGGDLIVLQGVTMASLTASDFAFG